MRKTLFATVVLTIGLLGASASADVDIKLDFGTSAGPAESGWILVHNSQRLDNGTNLDDTDGLPTGVTAGVTAWNRMTGGDRGDPASGGDKLPPSERDLLRDFMQPTNTDSSFEIRGLPAGSYDVTLYRGDPHYGPGETNDSIMVNGVRIALPDWPADWANAVLSDFCVTIQVTLTGGEAIVLADAVNETDDGLGEWGKLSALTVSDASVVPEPATLALLAIGASGFLLRRRRK